MTRSSGSHMRVSQPSTETLAPRMSSASIFAHTSGRSSASGNSRVSFDDACTRTVESACSLVRRSAPTRSLSMGVTRAVTSDHGAPNATQPLIAPVAA